MCAPMVVPQVQRSATACLRPSGSGGDRGTAAVGPGRGAHPRIFPIGRTRAYGNFLSPDASRFHQAQVSLTSGKFLSIDARADGKRKGRVGSQGGGGHARRAGGRASPGGGAKRERGGRRGVGGGRR